MQRHAVHGGSFVLALLQGGMGGVGVRGGVGWGWGGGAPPPPRLLAFDAGPLALYRPAPSPLPPPTHTPAAGRRAARWVKGCFKVQEAVLHVFII